MGKAAREFWTAGPSGTSAQAGEAFDILSPADLGNVAGRASPTAVDSVGAAVNAAVEAQPGWDSLGAAKRADILDRIGDLYEQNEAEFMAILASEGGKNLPDGSAEVRDGAEVGRCYAAP